MKAHRDPNITDVERRLSNSIIIGRVSQVDHAKARYRVKSGETETDWIPMAQRRAGGTMTYESLDIDEQVIVASPGGDLAQGIILGALMKSGTQAADKGNIHRTKYPDGTIVDYDHEAKTFLVAVAEGGSFTLNIGGGSSIAGSGGALKLTAPSGLDIDAAYLRHNGVNVGDTHVHGGVLVGPDDTDVPH